MRKPKPTPTVIRIGSLQDDMTALAGLVIGTLGDGPRCVWVEDDSRVYSGDPSDRRELPASWIVGTFSCGHPLIEIEEDLRAVATERSRNWIVG